MRISQITKLKWVTMAIIFVLLFLAVLAIVPAQGSANLSTYSDEFTTITLDPKWTWVNPLGDCSYSLTANPGYLRIFVPGKGHNLFRKNLNAPRLIQKISGDFVVETKFVFSPFSNHQAAGILVWDNENNFLRFERIFDSWWTPKSKIEQLYEDSHLIDPNQDPVSPQRVDLVGAREIPPFGTFGDFFHWYTLSTYPLNTPETWLSLQRKGDTFTATFSSDGVNWSELGKVKVIMPGEIFVGLFVLVEHEDFPIFADFDYFRVVVPEACFPDDTMAPTGAIHAHDNMLWPPDTRMITVTLDGYVIDELSIARDEAYETGLGGGIGVASAYLLVDGTKIILRDDSIDLLGEDGSFSVEVEVEAVKGAVYTVELYATDTEPEEGWETPGPNSGLVDSTYIRVPHDMSRGKSGR